MGILKYLVILKYLNVGRAGGVTFTSLQPTVNGHFSKEFKASYSIYSFKDSIILNTWILHFI